MLQENPLHHRKQVHLLDRLLQDSVQFAEELQQSDPRATLYRIVPAIQRIDLTAGQMTIRIKVQAWRAMIDAAEPAFSAITDDVTHAVVVPLAIRRRGVETRLIIGNGKDLDPSVDQVLVRKIATARLRFEDLKSGAAASINDIATRDNVTASEVSRELPLAFLAPRIVATILAGRQPVDFTAKTLTRLPELPLGWSEQAQLLGFNTN